VEDLRVVFLTQLLPSSTPPSPAPGNSSLSTHRDLPISGIVVWSSLEIRGRFS
jgi:hypothetical protein